MWFWSRREVIVYCSLFVVEHDERNDPSKGAMTPVKNLGQCAFRFHVNEGGELHHCTGIARTNVLVCSCHRLVLFMVIFTAKLRGLPR